MPGSDAGAPASARLAAVVLAVSVLAGCEGTREGATGATAIGPGPATTPEATLRRYLAAVGEADRLAATQRFRAEGMPAYNEVANVVAQGETAAAELLARRQAVVRRHHLVEVGTLIASDQERRLVASLVQRGGDGDYRVEAGVIRVDGRWLIAFEVWGDGDGSRIQRD